MLSETVPSESKQLKINLGLPILFCILTIIRLIYTDIYNLKHKLRFTCIFNTKVLEHLHLNSNLKKNMSYIICMCVCCVTVQSVLKNLDTLNQVIDAFQKQFVIRLLFITSVIFTPYKIKKKKMNTVAIKIICILFIPLYKLPKSSTFKLEN